MGFPAWRYGPNGAAEIFETEADVPEGWVDHPSLVVDLAPEPEPLPEPLPEPDAGPHPLDHDGDGAPGGSIAPESTDRLKDLRAEYQALIGKRPFPGWDKAELERRMAEHKPEIDITEF